MRPTRFLLAVLLVLAACGTSPVQPPIGPPGIARVELVTDKGTLFQGRALPGQLLVARVTDSAGNAVSGAVLSAVATPGWTVRGDTIVAPELEGSGTVRIVASRSPAASAGQASGAAAGDSAVSDGVTVTSVLNLDTLKLSGTTFTCRYPNNVRTFQEPNGYFYNDSVGPIDSITYVAPVVDSVVYDKDVAGYGYYIGVYGWAGELFLSADVLIIGGSPANVAHVHETWLVALTSQVPDTLAFAGTRGGSAVAVRASGPKPSYVTSALPFCEGVFLTTTASAVTFTSR